MEPLKRFICDEKQLETLIEKTEEKIRVAFRGTGNIEKAMDEAFAAEDAIKSWELPEDAIGFLHPSRTGDGKLTHSFFPGIGLPRFKA
jgi:hypothetical protein